MRKLLRDTIKIIETGGGTNISVTDLTRHSRINFTIDGRRENVLIHVGDIVTRRQLPSLRSELRRKGLKL